MEVSTISSNLDYGFQEAEGNLEKVLDHFRFNNHGCVVSPGKFQGEPIYVPYFWEFLMDGTANDEIVLIDSIDIKFFPNLDVYEKIRIWEDGLGFINHELIKE